MRALWVLRTSLTSPASDRHARPVGAASTASTRCSSRCAAAATRTTAAASSRSPTDLARQPATFDPLAAVIEAAHAAGIRVHAWINVNLVSSAVDLPSPREHLVHRHPEWLMVPRDIAQELARVAGRQPRLRRQAGALDARAVDGRRRPVCLAHRSRPPPAHVEVVVRDITRRYALDGIHFDYARYPTDRFDYSRAAIEQFRAQRPSGPAPRHAAGRSTCRRTRRPVRLSGCAPGRVATASASPG